MKINSENKDVLNKIYLHDAIFTGFTYDYAERQIKIVCENRCTGKLHELAFENVISSVLQSCEFWGPSPEVYGMWTEEKSSVLEKLYEQQLAEDPMWVYSQMKKDNNYIIAVIQLISGDKLEIICESVDHTESELDA